MNRFENVWGEAARFLCGEGLGEGALYGERSRVGRGDPMWVVFTRGPLLWADGQD